MNRAKAKAGPRITYSPITGQWFCLTKYRKETHVDATTGERRKFLRALEKHDITEQMITIIREVERRTLTRKRPRS